MSNDLTKQFPEADSDDGHKHRLTYSFYYHLNEWID